MNGAKAIAKKYNEVSLILRIVVGLVIGAVLALAVPGAGWVGEMGSLFVGALKGIAPVLERVRNTLIPIRISAAGTGRNALRPPIPVK